MLKLYHKPLACSLAVHIALRELDLPFEAVKVTDEGTARLADGEDYYQIHPLGAVPTLRLSDGSVMTEASVILEYLGSRGRSTQLAPVAGDADYWAFRQIMNFIATDIHKNYGPLFYSGTPEAMKKAWIDRLDKRLSYLSGNLRDRFHLLERGYSVADIYLFVMLFWASFVGIDIKKWKVLSGYFDSLSSRPAIRQALEVERS